MRKGRASKTSRWHLFARSILAKSLGQRLHCQRVAGFNAGFGPPGGCIFHVRVKDRLPISILFLPDGASLRNELRDPTA